MRDFVPQIPRIIPPAIICLMIYFLETDQDWLAAQIGGSFLLGVAMALIWNYMSRPK